MQSNSQSRYTRKGGLRFRQARSRSPEKPSRQGSTPLSVAEQSFQLFSSQTGPLLFAGKQANAHLDLSRIRLHEGTIKNPQVVDFLKVLVKQINHPLSIVWDGLKAHRSRLVREYLDSLEGRIELAFLLPPYAPDLNPVEYLWAWLKRHALANYCADSIADLAYTTRGKLKSAQRRTTLTPLSGNRLICSDVTRLRNSQ